MLREEMEKKAEDLKRSQQKYFRSKEGVTNVLYCGHRRSSKERGHPVPPYNLSELREWCYSQRKFHRLYDRWVTSGYLTEKKPSIDRIDSIKSYTFDNMQLLTYYENNCKNGRYESNRIPRYMNILQKDSNGKIVKEWAGIKPTAKLFGVGIYRLVRSLNNKNITCCGYHWERTGRNENDGINFKRMEIKNSE